MLPGRTDNAVKNRFHAKERAKTRTKGDGVIIETLDGSYIAEGEPFKQISAATLREQQQNAPPQTLGQKHNVHQGAVYRNSVGSVGPAALSVEQQGQHAKEQKYGVHFSPADPMFHPHYYNQNNNHGHGAAPHGVAVGGPGAGLGQKRSSRRDYDYQPQIHMSQLHAHQMHNQQHGQSHGHIHHQHQKLVSHHIVVDNQHGGVPNVSQHGSVTVSVQGSEYGNSSTDLMELEIISLDCEEGDDLSIFNNIDSYYGGGNVVNQSAPSNAAGCFPSTSTVAGCLSTTSSKVAGCFSGFGALNSAQHIHSHSQNQGYFGQQQPSHQSFQVGGFGFGYGREERENPDIEPCCYGFGHHQNNTQNNQQSSTRYSSSNSSTNMTASTLSGQSVVQRGGDYRGGYSSMPLEEQQAQHHQQFLQREPEQQPFAIDFNQFSAYSEPATHAPQQQPPRFDYNQHEQLIQRYNMQKQQHHTPPPPPQHGRAFSPPLRNSSPTSGNRFAKRQNTQQSHEHLANLSISDQPSFGQKQQTLPPPHGSYQYGHHNQQYQNQGQQFDTPIPHRPNMSYPFAAPSSTPQTYNDGSSLEVSSSESDQSSSVEMDNHNAQCPQQPNHAQLEIEDDFLADIIWNGDI